MTKRILVVEDQEDNRQILRDLLANAGYEMIEAEDGEQALQRAESHVEPIDLLVTDLVMTRMGGLELARRLKAVRPGLRVLYVSGYSWNSPVPPSDRAAGVDFLRKPFTPQTLVDRAARLIADLAGPPPDPRATGGRRPKGGHAQ